MNILRAFLCGCSFRTIDEIFAKQYNNDSNLFTHAQIRSTLFLKILNDIFVRWYSDLPLKDGGSLAFHETEESQAARTTLWTI